MNETVSKSQVKRLMAYGICAHHKDYNPAKGEPTNPLSAMVNYGSVKEIPCPYCWQARAKLLEQKLLNQDAYNQQEHNQREGREKKLRKKVKHLEQLKSITWRDNE